MVRISICIPVYNFGAFIGQTLDSIRSQCKEALGAAEVLVVDGASTDDTAAVVGLRSRDWEQLKYIRLPRRGGIDVDLAESVRMASGEYCWFFSGDDVMRPGSLARASSWLQEGHDVYICKSTICDINAKVLGERAVLRGESVRIAELSNQSQRISYLTEGANSLAVFSFMSSLIVRRAKWLSIPDPQEFMGSCFGHVARLFTAAQTQLRVCYVGEKWVDCRGGNDSFLEHGLVNRLRISVDGYHSIADRFFGHESPEAAQIRRMVRNDLGLRLWLLAKVRTHEAPHLESRPELDRLVARCYEDPDIGAWLIRTAYRLTPVMPYRAIRLALRRVTGISSHSASQPGTVER